MADTIIATNVVDRYGKPVWQGPSAALSPILILLVFAAVVTFIATRVFRWDAASSAVRCLIGKNAA